MMHSIPPHTNFQQECAPPHYSLAVPQLLDNRLPNSWIVKRGRTACPGSSAALTRHYFSYGDMSNIRSIRSLVPIERNLGEESPRQIGALLRIR